MKRRSMLLNVAFALLLSVMVPIAASGAEDTPQFTVQSGAVSVSGDAPVAANPKALAPIEVDTTSIIAATSRAKSLAREQGVSVDSDGFLAKGLVSVIVTFDETTNAQEVAAAVGGEVMVTYERALNGAAIILSPGKLKQLGKTSGVTAVFANELRQTQTSVSPQFIGADEAWEELGGQGVAGEGIVIGVVDTGIWPEHPSVADDGTYPPPPPSWTGTTCEFGSATPGDVPFACNNKLIGATYAMPAYSGSGLLLSTEFVSARDDNGHGTHTATTAAGNGGVAASIFGVDRGFVSGIAPRAHIAAYKACGDLGCFESDLIFAIDSAIADGVDVINYSIGGGSSDPYSDASALAFLSAYDNGIFVATSAGNSGPGANTVGSPGDAPWVTTVGASSTDRQYQSTVTVVSGGNELVLTGATVTAGINTPTEVILADASDPLCLVSAQGSFDYTDKVVICERGAIARVAKSFNVLQQGAAGMLLYNPTTQGLATDNHFIPSVHLEADAGALLLDFMATNVGSVVTATFTGGIETETLGDVMASFSSRGGDSYLTIKPDVTAPGVQILAGNTPMPATITGGLPGELFQSIQGTSMSSPHVAGAAALLAQMNPDWTPGQIKSALMLTAKQDGVFKEDGTTPSDYFDRGSGRIDLSVAGDSGLTIDESAADFLANQGKEWENNYPSVWVPVLPGKITVERTVQNESSSRATWKLSVSAPDDVKISVPRRIRVPGNGEATFEIKIDARNVPVGEIRMAEITLKKGDQRLHIPVAFKRAEAAVTINKTCDPSTFKQWQSTTCTITIQNNSFSVAEVDVRDKLPRKLLLDPFSISGGDWIGWNKVGFSGALGPATPPSVAIIEAASPAGYLPLAGFGIPPATPPSNADDGALVLTGLDFSYGGINYTDAIWSVNGAIEAGTTSGLALGASNSALPSATLPNNLIAPWWTDLNLNDGGDLYIGALGDGISTWDVIEWANVALFGDPTRTYSFQIWIERGTANISFAYGAGDATEGATGTVGAEDAAGSSGDTYYFNGTGTNPWIGSPDPDNPTGPPIRSDLAIETGAAIPGETHVITFDALGIRRGNWTNWATLTSDAFAGTAIDGASGTIERASRPPWGWR